MCRHRVWYRRPSRQPAPETARQFHCLEPTPRCLWLPHTTTRKPAVSCITNLGQLRIQFCYPTALCSPRKQLWVAAYTAMLESSTSVCKGSCWWSQMLSITDRSVTLRRNQQCCSLKHNGNAKLNNGCPHSNAAQMSRQRNKVSTKAYDMLV